MQKASIPSGKLEADGQPSKARSDGLHLLVLVFSRLNLLHHTNDGIGRVEEVERVEMVGMGGWGEFGELL